MFLGVDNTLAQETGPLAHCRVRRLKSLTFEAQAAPLPYRAASVGVNASIMQLTTHDAGLVRCCMRHKLVTYVPVNVVSSGS